MLPEKIDMQHYQTDQEGRKHSSMQGKETGKGMVARLVASDKELLQVVPDKGSISHDIGGNLRGPVSLLVPGEQVTGQPEAHCHAKEGKTEPEIEFTRSRIGAVYNHLHQVQDQQDNHELRSPVMNSPQPVTTLHVLLKVMNAFPCRVCTRTVEHPEHDPCDELDHDGKGQGAAPDITPAGPSRDILKKSLTSDPPDTGTIINPVQKVLHRDGK